MRITREMKIAGLPAVELREVMKRWGEGVVPSSGLLPQLSGNAETARCAVADLLADGYIEEAEGGDGETSYATTTKGCALALASMNKPIRRSTADRLVTQVVERARKVNEDKSYFYQVSKILVFGSYLADSPTLGDVDLAIELCARVPGTDRDAQALIHHTRMARTGGGNLSFVDRMVWPKAQVIQALRGSSKALSFHPIDDPEMLEADRREIFQA